MDIPEESSSAVISRSTLDRASGYPAAALARSRPAMPEDLAAQKVQLPEAVAAVQATLL
jgi:hypothetical protein